MKSILLIKIYKKENVFINFKVLILFFGPNNWFKCFILEWNLYTLNWNSVPTYYRTYRLGPKWYMLIRCASATTCRMFVFILHSSIKAFLTCFLNPYFRRWLFQFENTFLYKLVVVSCFIQNNVFENISEILYFFLLYTWLHCSKTAISSLKVIVNRIHKYFHKLLWLLPFPVKDLENALCLLSPFYSKDNINMTHIWALLKISANL